LAIRAGVAPWQAWEWPLIVDGVIVVATVSVVALQGRKGTGYAWGLLIGGAAVSVACNAWQAARMDTEESAWMAGFVATIPPVVLLAATHMTVILTRPDDSPSIPMVGTVRAGVDDRLVSAAQPEGAQSAPDAVVEALGAVPAAGSVSAAPGVVLAESGVGSRTWRVEKAIRLRAEGWTVAEIATRVGVSTGSIRRYLKSAVEASLGREEQE
jgi:hypothetical protein